MKTKINIALGDQYTYASTTRLGVESIFVGSDPSFANPLGEFREGEVREKRQRE